MSIFAKNTKLKPISTSISLLFLVSVSAMNVQAADYYEIIDLGAFEEGGLNQTSVFDVNNNSIAVGQAAKRAVPDPQDPDSIPVDFIHAFSYDLFQPELVDLGAIDNSEVPVEITNIVDSEPVTQTINVGQPFTTSIGFSISEQNIVVGVSSRIFGSVVTTTNEGTGETTETAAATIVERAFYLEPNSTEIQEIPDFVTGQNLNMRALAINNDVVVGIGKFNVVTDVDSQGNDIISILDHGFFYLINSDELFKVSPLGIDQNMSLRDVNINGYAVGVSSENIDGINTEQVIGVDINSPNVTNKIEIFGGVSQQAWAINDNNIIVGRAINNAGNALVAFSHDLANQQSTELGVLNENFPQSAAFGINNVGQIVGNSLFQNSINRSIPPVFHAFLYENNTMKDLNSLIDCDTGWRLDEARAINESGTIVGNGILNGERHAFMLTEKFGTAPICEVEEEEDDNGGAVPIVGLLGLFFVALIRRQRD